MTARLSVVTRVPAQPLFLAQTFASGAGALAMVMAATAMPPGRFTTFALLTLVTNTCTGAVRSVLFQPALVETRNNRNAHLHVRVALLGALCASACFLAAAAGLGVREPLWLAILSLSNMLPVIAEWLRIRGMALDERWNVARGDAIRLATTVLGAPVLWLTTEAEVFFLLVNLTYLTTVVYLAFRLPRVSAHLSPLHYWQPAFSQFADFIIGQSVSTIPLLVLAGFGSSVYIGGIRIAQTLLGPLNLVLAASAMNLLADGATRDSHSNPADLIRHGRRLATILGVFSMMLVPLVLLALFLTNFSFRGADNRSLIVGVLLVGALAVTWGFAGVDCIIMRLLGHHSIVTVGRVFLVAVTGACYALGFVIGGVDSSLIVGFTCAAVATPLAFVLPASIVYRRYR